MALSLAMRWVARFALGISAAALIVMTLMITAEAILRSFAGYSMDFVHELSGYCVVLLTVVGGAVSFRERGFFSVTLLYERLPPAAKRLLLWLHVLLSVAICGALVKYTWALVWSSYEGGNVSSTTLATPLYLPQIILPLGLLLLISFLVEHLASGVSGQARNSGDN